MSKANPTSGQLKAKRRIAKLSAALVERGCPEPVTEHQFHYRRKWRFDLAWPGLRVAIEMHGGSFSGGRHTRGGGFGKDCEKLTMAASMGWLVCPLTHGQAGDEEYIALVVNAVQWRREAGEIA